VQIAVSGPAAARLGAIARDRWRRAGGGDLPPIVGAAGPDPWPPGLRPVAAGVEVEIAETRPAVDEGDLARRDVARSLEAVLRSARRWVYVENQYFACHDLARRLRALLDDPAGPEVVLVAPSCCSGWLEQKTMGLLRRRFLDTVREGRFARERLRTVAPVVGDVEVFVHAKVLVVDDAFARVGSANWSTRSMSIDSECDVTVVAGRSAAHAAAVASLRDRLLAEHLGMREADVQRRLARDPSMVRLVDAAARGRRRLRPLDDAPMTPDEETWLTSVADPERPLDAAHVAAIFERAVLRESRRALGWWAAAALAIVALAAAFAGWGGW
jgi:phosphatidylserine/phosphatidylglycerophosphate/cardiolipin synthase-like enzyme